MRQTPYFTSGLDRVITILAGFALRMDQRSACLANGQRHLIMTLVEASLKVHSERSA